MYEAYADGSYKNGQSSVGYIIYKDDEYILHKRKIVQASGSDELEYIALLELISDLNKYQLTNVKMFTDSKNLIETIRKCRNGCNVKNKITRSIVRELSKFANRKLERIPSSKNKAHKVCRGEFDKVSPAIIEIIPDPMKPARSKVKQKENRKEIKMVIRYRRHLLMRCPSCMELKAATEYPRRRINRGHRKCNSCSKKLNMIHNSF